MASARRELALNLSGGCQPLADESSSLGIGFVQIGSWRVRVVAMDLHGPLTKLGGTPDTATPIESDCFAQKTLFRKSQGDAQLTAFFVHGAGGRAGQFKHQIHFLAQRGIRCIAPDLPGHGLSPAPLESDTCSSEESETIVKVIYDAMADTRGSPGQPPNVSSRRSLLIGHSFGFLEVLRLYEQLALEGRGQEVAGICLIGCDGRMKLCGTALLLPSLLSRILLQLLRYITRRFLQRLQFSSETYTTNPRLLQQELQIAYKAPNDHAAFMHSAIRSGEARMRLKKATEVLRRQTPRPAMLLLYGESDALAPPAESSRFLSSAFGYGPLSLEGVEEGQDAASTSARSESISDPVLRAVVIAKAGHNVMLERAIETNRIIWGFAKGFLGQTSDTLSSYRQEAPQAGA